MLARPLVRSGSFIPPSGRLAFPVASAPEGGWVWFGAPRAIRSGDETITGYTTGSSGGDVKAIRIDNDTNVVIETTTLYNNFLLDDHQPPSFVVRPDGYILAAFAYHVGELYVGIGPSAGDLPAQADVTNITSQVGALSGGAGYTYASIRYVPGESRYYVFFRYHDAGGTAYLGYTYSDDDGATWAARTLVCVITYHQTAQTGDRIDFVLSDHPDYSATSIYHMYFEGGNWFKTDGTQIVAGQPFAVTAATLVYDGSTNRAWLWDVAVDAGNPRVVYVVYDASYPSGTWHYQRGHWSGSAWVTHEIATAGTQIPTSGSEHYAGGIVLDHEDPDVVWYSGNAGGSFQVFRAVTADNGATWTPTAMTADADKNVRPVSVVGHDGRIEVLWLYGTYTDYFTYAQGIKGAGS